MSRGVSPNSTTYELVNSCNSFTKSICEKDVITNLKVQVFAKDQNKKKFPKFIINVPQFRRRNSKNF